METKSIIEPGYRNFTCAICFSLLPAREELLQEHNCFNGKTVYSSEGMIYCLSDDNISNEEFNEFDSNSILNNNDTDTKPEPCIQLKHTTPPKKPNKNVAMWTDSSTLALLTCYEAKKEDLDHPVKRGKVWSLIADDLSELGYKFTGEQVRWKFNTLTRKYKDCVDNSKKTGTGAMTFKFFDHMENILGDRKMIQGQSTISSTFTKKNAKSKSSNMLSTFMAQSDTPVSSPSTSSIASNDSAKKEIYQYVSKLHGSSKNKQVLGKMATSNIETIVYPTSVSNAEKSKRPQRQISNMLSTFIAQSDTPVSSPSTSSIESSDSAKKEIYQNVSKLHGSSKNKQAFGKMATSNVETIVCPTSVNNAEKSKRPQHGSGSRTAESKIQLEKQWLEHLKNLADTDKIRKEKQEAYEKRKVEELQMKRKLVALKERQLHMKQNIARRKQEEIAEWHQEKLNIEKQKCRLLRDLLHNRNSSRNKTFKTDTNSSCED